MFRDLLLNTLWVYEIIEQYELAFKLLWGVLAVLSLVLFIYHLMAYYELEFFLENIDILGDFSMGFYKFCTIVVSLVPLFSVVVIIWSAFEGFNSRKFLKRFGCSF